MQDTQRVVALTLAALAGAVTVLALLLAGVRRRSRGAAEVLMTLSLAGAPLLAYRPLMQQWPTTSLQTDVVQRLLWATALVLGAGAVLTASGRGRWRVLALTAGAAVSAAVVLVGAFWHFPPPEGVSRAAFLGRQLVVPWGCVVVGWALLEPMAERSPGAAVPLVAGFVSAGVGVLILVTPSTAPGMSAAAVGASTAGVLAAAWVAALLARKMTLPVTVAGGPVLVWLSLLAGLMTFACLDNEAIPATHLLLIGAALPLAWLAELPAVRRWKPAWRELLRAALVAAPVVAAAALAIAKFRQEAADSGGY